MTRSRLGAKSQPGKAINPNDEGKKLKELDDTQTALRDQIMAFAKELKMVSVPSTRTKADQERVQSIMFNMAELSLKLNRLSMAEGAQSTATASLHLLYRMNDKVNELLLQNAALNERLKKIEEGNGSLHKKNISGDSTGKATT